MSKSRIGCLGVLALILVLWPSAPMETKGAPGPASPLMSQTKSVELSESERALLQQQAEERAQAEIQAAQEAAREARCESTVQALSEYSRLNSDIIMYLVRRVEEKELPLRMVAGLIDLESHWNISERNESSGATGLGQIMPITARFLVEGEREADGKWDHSLVYYQQKLKDPYFNIDVMVAALDNLRNEYGDDWNRILTAYNRGEQGLADWIRDKGTPVSVYSRVVKTRANTIESVTGPL